MPAHPETMITQLIGNQQKKKVTEKELPYNQSIYMKMRASWSINKTLQDVIFISACIMCVLMPFHGKILSDLFGVSVFGYKDSNWDASNNIMEFSSDIMFENFPINFYWFGHFTFQAVEHAVLPKESNNNVTAEEFSFSSDFKMAFYMTISLFLILVCIDSLDMVSWPKAWLKEGVQKAITFEELVATTTTTITAAGGGAEEKKVEEKEKTKNNDGKSPKSDKKLKKRSRTPGKKRKNNNVIEKTNKDLNKVLVDAAISPFETITTHCYEEMFSEPMRIVHFERNGKKALKPALFSRTGNVYSNFIYIFASIYVILVNGKLENFAPFQIPDLIFGIMLFILAILSIVWHGSHYNKIHVYDLASMDFCIGYCIIRLLCMVPASKTFSTFLASKFFNGITDSLVVNYLNDSNFGWNLSGIICTTVCILFLMFLFRNKDTMHGDLEHSCGFSGRKRLVLGEMDMFGACLYLTMPIVYFTLPILLQIFVFKTAGSYILSFSAGFTLSVGWSYRFTERFCLDGNILMKNAWNNLIIIGNHRADTAITKSFFHKVFDFIISLIYGTLFSPTAVLHWATGFTLLFAYSHCKSIENEMMMKM